MRFILIISLVLISLQAKSFFSNSDQADSSVYIGSLKDLVIATQKTRGLTNSFMNGNTAALLLVYDNRNDMKRAIGTMESLPLAADPIINSRATAISQALIKLNNKALKLDSAETFSNYTEQIGQTLMLAQTVSQRFSKDLNPFGQDASKIMMEVMLPMTEYVGQMRGFGSGLAAKGERTQAQLEKINVLANEIDKLNIKLQKQMSLLTSRYPTQFQSSTSQQLQKLNDISNAYISFAKDKFKNDITKIDPNTYFDNGTKLISSIIKVYNTNNKAILEDSKGWI